MIFRPCRLAGAFLIEPERSEDERGFFARTFCRQEFTARGLNPDVVQCNTSFNRARGTLRGMHFQRPPGAEAKLVRCTNGAIYDVMLDLRPESPSYCEWQGFELTARNRSMLYIPERFAHGFQTLEDESEVLYQMSEPFAPELAAGVRFDDPAFGIRWPVPDPIVSDKDRGFPDFERASRP